MTPKRFRVAFSFAGEKREFVAKVAGILAKRFGKKSILYDRYHIAEFARGDLGFYLPDLYYEQTDLIVVIVSPGYKQSEWCGLEWKATYALLKRGNDDSVMLCRFGLAEVKGLFSIEGFADLDTKTPAQTAALILERLAINEAQSSDNSLEEAIDPTPPAQPIAKNHTVFNPCQFDLDDFTQKSMSKILPLQNGLIGFGIYSHSLPLLNQCCERIRLERGRSKIHVRDPLTIDPILNTAEMAVQHVLEFRKELEIKDVLLMVKISDQADAHLFWSRLKMSLPAVKHKLIILMALSKDCACPKGLIRLKTPQFGLFHAYRWVCQIVEAMKWREDFIDFWVDRMVAECTGESAELYPEQVYNHLNETIKFIQESPELADFQDKLVKRESIYVPS